MEVIEPSSKECHIVIMGGTFDPVHNGHIKAVKTALCAFSPCRLLIIPTNIPPHKEIASGGATANQRLEMLNLAFNGMEQITVSNIEILRPGRSYTIDTLEQLKQMYPKAMFKLIVGTDMLLSFEKWYRFSDILSSAALVAMPRLHDDLAAVRAKADRLRKLYNARVLVLPIEPIEVSSTIIRTLAANGDDLSCFVPKSVSDYITSNNLYR